MKVLMVCLGNICRSPIAHGILEKKAAQNQLNIIVDSAGTGSWHINKSPDIRSIEVAKSYGIDISKQKARQFNVMDFEKFDIIYVMDKSNFNTINGLDIEKKYSKKIKLILNEIYPNKNNDVPDPYYGEENGFEVVYNLLDKASDKIIQQLKNDE